MHRVPCARALLVVALLALVGVSCSKSADSVAPPATSNPAPSSSASGGPAGAAGADCTAASLTPVVQAKHPSATLAELVCDGPFAVATVKGGAGLPANGVALFRLVGTSWSLVTSADAEAAPATFVPADFSSTTYTAWKAKFIAATHPEQLTTTSSKSTGPTGPAPITTPVNTVPAKNCTGEGVDEKCELTTTTVPVTTPDGQTVPPVTSQFCRFNYIDPRCVANGQFPG